MTNIAFSAMKKSTERFLASHDAKRVKFSQRDPSLWLELAAAANPPTLTVCRHLESEEADKACPCGYAGSVWADGEHMLFTMGDQRDVDDAFRAPRIDRTTEIATAQLLACLYNNAEWLIELAAKAMETGTAKTEGLGAKHDSAARRVCPQ